MIEMTITEQVIARAACVSRVAPGDEVWANVDLAVMNDSSGPRRMAPILDELGGAIWDSDRLVLVADHFVPPANIRHSEILQKTRQWATGHQIKHFYQFEGILHTLLLEKRLVRPGMLVVGADSHTVTAGALGAVAVGISSTEMATVLSTGQIWLRVPPTIQIFLENSLPKGVTVRDVTFKILGTLGSDFALYKAMEFRGPALGAFSLDDRAVLANQSIEMGAKNAVIEPNDESLGRSDLMKGAPGGQMRRDSDLNVEKALRFDLSNVEPALACPHDVSNVETVRDRLGEAVDTVYVGSCVGGRLADLEAAAGILEGRRVKIPTLVAPATKKIMLEGMRRGVVQAIAAAGATILPAGCGACAGLHSGVLGPNQRCMSTATRNFRGRMGDPSASIFLASPFTVAATALEGRISDPREYV